MPDQGDVVWIRFPGAVVTKQRPAVVLSSREYHAARPDAIFGLITGQVAKATAPTDYVIIDWPAAGLRVPSAFRSNLTTLPKTEVISTLGKLSANDFKAVQERVKRSLGI